MKKVSSMKKTKNKFLGGAFILGLGTFIAKLLGAIYRFPLARILGSAGLGLYQMVFPVYSVLLDFSGAGLPNALSKLISGIKQDKEKKARKYLLVSVKTFAILGLTGFFLMAVLSVPFSKAQGNEKAYLAYITLSPSVLIVSLICCFRGYFQGNNKMMPTALTQIIEQTVKLGLGLALAYLLSNSLIYATAGATLAITISELIALAFLFVLYKKQNAKNTNKITLEKGEYKSIIKTIIKIAVPVTLIGIMLPLSQVVDSFLALNIISSYRSDGTNLYGLFSGGVMPVIGLPVAVCYGLATASVPLVSGEKDKTKKQQHAKRVIGLTLVAGLVFSLMIFFASPLIVKVLFSSLKSYEKSIMIKLLRLCSPSVLFLSVLQTQNSVLIGMGKPYSALFSLGLGVVVKIILSAILLSNAKMNIYGLGLGVIACYFCAVLVNLITLVKQGSKNENKTHNAFRVTNQE